MGEGTPGRRRSPACRYRRVVGQHHPAGSETAGHHLGTLLHHDRARLLFRLPGILPKDLRQGQATAGSRLCIQRFRYPSPGLVRKRRYRGTRHERVRPQPRMAGTLRGHQQRLSGHEARFAADRHHGPRVYLCHWRHVWPANGQPHCHELLAQHLQGSLGYVPLRQLRVGHLQPQLLGRLCQPLQGVAHRQRRQLRATDEDCREISLAGYRPQEQTDYLQQRLEYPAGHQDTAICPGLLPTLIRHRHSLHQRLRRGEAHEYRNQAHCRKDYRVVVVL